MNIKDALEKALPILKKGTSPKAREDARLLMCHVLQRDKTFLIARDTDYFLTEAEKKNYFELVKKRSQNVPIQHLTGRQEFYGRDFEVSKDVLIPRPETEILVEMVLEIISPESESLFCDVGTGSGAIGVSILAERPQSRAFALDILPKPLEITRSNAEKHDVMNRLKILQSDVFQGLNDYERESGENLNFDLIVSNPPYIPLNEADDLAREVIDFEPHTALFSGADGFDVIRILLAEAAYFLKPHGAFLFEIGFGQADKILSLIDEDVWRLHEIRRDLQGIPRIVNLQRR